MTEVEIWAGDKWADTTISPEEVKKDKRLSESIGINGCRYYYDNFNGLMVYKIKETKHDDKRTK